MRKILVAGGSGLIGRRLTHLLREKGYEVSILSRKKVNPNVDTVQWDIEGMSLNASDIEPFDHIIQLAGAGIADKAWTRRRKKEIIDSRVKPTQLLAKAIAENNKKPLSFISASAVGYYGAVFSDHIFTEEDPSGSDFLSSSCVAWENSISQIDRLGIPTATIRIGIVLSKHGGALKEIARPIQYGLGASLGSGKQYVPWIHIEDLCNLFVYTIEKNLEGTYNAVASNPTTNEQLTRTVAQVLKKPLWLPNIPEFVLSLILGQRKDLVLKGSRVSNKKILATGFAFQYDTLEKALRNIYA